MTTTELTRKVRSEKVNKEGEKKSTIKTLSELAWERRTLLVSVVR